jgi:hypothetical protein
MDTSTYLDLKARVVTAGYGREVDWAEDPPAIDAPCKFANEYIWVVLNSGMKNQVAQAIWDRVRAALRVGLPVRVAFKHPGKVAAIERALSPEGVEWFDAYRELETDEARLAYLETLPWIGPITKWHLAKNLGVDCAKPDRHLVRIADGEQAAHDLCARLAEATGDRVATVDLVIWRAANLGWV